MEEAELKKEIQNIAKKLYLLGWRSKDVKHIVGMNQILSGDEKVQAMKANWERPNHSLKPYDWTKPAENKKDI